MCNLFLPLKVLCHNQGKTEASKKIRAEFVQTVRRLLPSQTLTPEEKLKLQTMLPQLEEAEPELVTELKKLL